MLLSFGWAFASFIWNGVWLVLISLLFRFIFRTLIRRGDIQVQNPFQPGWKQLHRSYGTVQVIRPTEYMSGTIGAVKYENSLRFRFEDQHWILQNMDISGLLVQIPYTDIETLQTPTAFQVTRFSETEYTSGIFMIGNVKVELPAYWADQLLRHMSAANTAAIS